MGGAIFVQLGSSVTPLGARSPSTATIAPSTGANDGSNGSAFGSDIFRSGASGTITFQPGAVRPRRFPRSSPTRSGSGGSLAKTGVGTLTLSGTNTDRGKTTIDAGTLAVGADADLGAAAPSAAARCRPEP
jgi:fibronectin-binding autotransporter adhesin